MSMRYREVVQSNSAPVFAIAPWVLGALSEVCLEVEVVAHGGLRSAAAAHGQWRFSHR